MEIAKLCIDPKDLPSPDVTPPSPPESPSEPARKRTSFPDEAQVEMSRWIRDHFTDPFLSREEETAFMVKYGITRKQVKTAFNNRRQRLAAPVRVRAIQQRQAHMATPVRAMPVPTIVQVQPVYWGPAVFARQ
jgi:hypothetical protein